MLHLRCSKPAAFATSGIVCSSLVFTLFSLAYGKRNLAATPPDMTSISSVQGKTATVNGLAPDISWRDQTSGKFRQISDLRGKPVILCFGSYTCGPFRTSLNLIDQVYRRNAGQITCLLIYTKEAHPELSQEAYMRNPHTREDRETAACSLSKQARLTMPILVDTLDNRAGTAFAARPSRIYVLDRKGNIAFASSESPASDMALGAVNAVNRMMGSKPVN
ncbi:MAG: Iodothyronine deiodinase [Chthonomonadaceae bacterium]|nr:Iodothyronine deiodinase [Chthonomonadaceae bacterium]